MPSKSEGNVQIATSNLEVSSYFWIKSFDCWFAFLLYSNRKFAELYAESLTGAITPKQIEAKKLNLAIHGWIPLYDLKKVEENAKCLRSFDDTAYSGLFVFIMIERFAIENKHAIYDYAYAKPTTLETKDRLEKLMDELKTGADGLTFAFKSERATKVYYYQRILRPKEFKFLKEDLQSIQPGTKSMLTYEQFLPFNNQLHNDEGCVSVEDLPRFYKEKGRVTT